MICLLNFYRFCKFCTYISVIQNYNASITNVITPYKKTVSNYQLLIECQWKSENSHFDSNSSRWENSLAFSVHVNQPLEIRFDISWNMISVIWRTAAADVLNVETVKFDLFNQESRKRARVNVEISYLNFWLIGCICDFWPILRSKMEIESTCKRQFFCVIFCRIWLSSLFSTLSCQALCFCQIWQRNKF